MVKNSGNILIVDDNEDLLLAARLFLKQHFSLVHTEQYPEKIPSLLNNENYDVILLDMNFTMDATSGSEGFMWLDKILQIDPAAVVILVTAYGDVEMAVKAVKAGATDFVLKPWQNEKLLATISSALSLRYSKLEVNKLRSRERQLSRDIDQRYHDMIGMSPSMQQVFTTIDKVASTDADVLILGENGTGKELVARALHRQSKRADEVFISVDMGAVVETLFESELFGHVKGAFTDAREDRAGRFELASGGTLLLDEIGNLSLAMQSKLLKVLEIRKITRVGSHAAREIDIRLICATNMPIHDMVSRGEFRQDLLYRVNTVEIRLPPLRERIGDVPLLAAHFLEVYSRKYKKSITGIGPAAMKKLERYHWPGNIRELRHTLERAVILSETPVLQPDLKIANLRRINDLAPISPKLVETLAGLTPGENRLVKEKRDENLLQLSIYTTGFVLRQRPLLLVAMQDIQNELEEKEMNSWQNLIRVLTHEIMNSIAPIASLASTANGLLAGECDVEPVDARSEKIRDVCAAVETIEKRSKGLIAFIEKYRESTRIPQPQFQIVRVNDLMERVKSLMQDQLAQKSVAFKTEVEPLSLEITADPAQIEQVLINLCKNALEAVNAREKAHIDLTADTDGHGNPVIKVTDNGKGIPEEVAERIFIPFFTTKPGGSGIGLSLSRQIMRLHKGTLSVGCTPGEETVFTLRF